MTTAPNPPPYRMRPKWATLTEGVNDPPPAAGCETAGRAPTAAAAAAGNPAGGNCCSH